MKPALGSLWRLVIRNNRAYVERLSDGQKTAALSAPEAVALGIMNGKRRLDDIEAVLLLMLGERSSELLKALLNRFQPLLVDTPLKCTTLPPLEKLAAVHPPEQKEGLRPLPGPRTLHWWVTSYCPRRCVYCFVQPRSGSHAPDATLPRMRLREIFSEAAEHGAQNLLIGGAEPLLRPDLPEVMGDAVESGINPLLTTKHPISPSLAERLSAGGVRHLSFSIDTVDPNASQGLVGSTAWPEQVRSSAQYLGAVGVAISIQAVASRLNPNALEGVAELASETGAVSLQVVPFEPVSRPITSVDNQQMALADQYFLDDEIARLRERHPDLNIEKFDELDSISRGGFQCDIGMTKMFFLPNGVVHRCYKRIHDLSLCGKDLTHTSVAEAWHDPEFESIITPSRESYRGSNCFACVRFEGCHESGRCIYQAHKIYGSYYMPDRLCEHVSK